MRKKFIDRFLFISRFRFHRGRKKNNEPTMADFSVVFPCVFAEDKAHILEVLGKQPRPDKIGEHVVPKDLNSLSYGALVDLQQASMKSETEAVAETFRIICGATPEDIANESVNKIFGFVNWATAEMTRINDLFANIRQSYESEEIQAGVQQLSFGTFGVLDWYAKRMGITNQNDVRDVAWVRIYTCMKMDNDKNEYERRLNKVYTSKHRK